VLDFHLFWAIADKANGVCLTAAWRAIKGAALRMEVAKKVIIRWKKWKKKLWACGKQEKKKLRLLGESQKSLWSGNNLIGCEHFGAKFLTLLVSDVALFPIAKRLIYDKTTWLWMAYKSIEYLLINNLTCLLVPMHFCRFYSTDYIKINARTPTRQRMPWNALNCSQTECIDCWLLTTTTRQSWSFAYTCIVIGEPLVSIRRICPGRGYHCWY
jgi:hypothetical protein